jgi:hypothetical protein
MTRPEAVQMVTPALHSGQLLDYVNIFIDRKQENGTTKMEVIFTNETR